MRTVMRVLLAIVGLLVLAAGLTAAAIVGSDDTVFTQPDTIEAGGAPIATTPDLFSYRDLRLTVRASSPDGVLVATGHPVDVADYLGDRIHYSLTGIRRDGLAAGLLDNDRDPVEVRPEEAGFWTASSVGAGTQSLTMEGGASPEGLVVASMGKTPVTMSFGATLDGVFALSLTLAALGGVLLVLAVWLMVRARRHRSSGGEAARQSRLVAPVVAVALITGAILVLRGGLALDVPEEVAYEQPSKVALTQDEVPAMLKNYDKRYRAAVKASRGPRYDETRWERADAEPLLGNDLFATYSASWLKGRASKATVKYSGAGEVFSGHFDSYPMWAMVPRDFAVVGKTKAEKARAKKVDQMTDPRHLVLFTRESAASDWRRAAHVAVEEAEIPTSSDARPLPTRAQVDVVRRRVTQLRGFVESGHGPWLSKEVQGDLRRQIAASRKASFLAGSHFSTAPLAAKDSRVYAVEVDGGVVAVTNFAMQFHLTAKAGTTLHWGAPFDSIMSTGSGRSLVDSYLATAVVFLPNDGQPTLLGLDWKSIFSNSSDGVPAVQG